MAKKIAETEAGLEDLHAQLRAVDALLEPANDPSLPHVSSLGRIRADSDTISVALSDTDNANAKGGGGESPPPSPP